MIIVNERHEQESVKCVKMYGEPKLSVWWIYQPDGTHNTIVLRVVGLKRDIFSKVRQVIIDLLYGIKQSLPDVVKHWQEAS